MAGGSRTACAGGSRGAARGGGALSICCPRCQALVHLARVVRRGIAPLHQRVAPVVSSQIDEFFRRVLHFLQAPSPPRLLGATRGTGVPRRRSLAAAGNASVSPLSSLAGGLPTKRTPGAFPTPSTRHDSFTARWWTADNDRKLPRRHRRATTRRQCARRVPSVIARRRRSCSGTRGSSRNPLMHCGLR